MSIEDQYYSFIVTGEETVLSSLFFNYLTLGEYELGRACLLQIFRQDPQRAVNYLIHLIQNGFPNN